jgi:hypothetical protein
VIVRDNGSIMHMGNKVDWEMTLRTLSAKENETEKENQSAVESVESTVIKTMDDAIEPPFQFVIEDLDF